jgi:hypothetical protein
MAAAEDGTLEAALAATERQADDALRVATGVVRELRRAKAGAASGQLRDLRRSLEAAATSSAALAAAAHDLRTGFTMDTESHLASGAYTKELLAAAAAAGVEVFEEDDQILAYPSLIRVLAADGALDIDRRRERRLRPSVVARLLATAQRRGPRFRAEAFLDSLRGAYELVVARQGSRPDAVVRLLDVWSVLTLLPGQSREYSRQEFARDLYLLDSSGTTSTPRSPRVLRWSASTGTRGGGVLTTVARGGQRQRYWGIAFTPADGEA